MLDTLTDGWLYQPERMALREACLSVLLKKFGSDLQDGNPIVATRSIYECAHDWVSQGTLSLKELFNTLKSIILLLILRNRITVVINHPCFKLPVLSIAMRFC